MAKTVQGAGRARVKVDTSGMKKWRQKIRSGGDRSLIATATRAAANTRALTPVGTTGRGATPGTHARDSIKVGAPYTHRGRRQIDYGGDDPVLLWLEAGTRGRKGRAKTKRTRDKRAAAGITHSGLKPHRMFKKGLRSSFMGGFVSTLRRSI